MTWMTKASIILALTLAVTISFSAGMASRALSAQDTNTVKLAAIESIAATGEGDAAELVIKLSAPVTYTSYKTTAPLRLVVDLSQATPGAITEQIAINKGNFKNVSVSRFDTDAGVLTRMNVELVNDAVAVISASPAQPGELRIAFQKQSAPVTDSAPVATAPSGAEKAAETSKIETLAPSAAEKAAEAPQQAPAAVPQPSETAALPPASHVAAESAPVTAPESAEKAKPAPAVESIPLLKAISVKDESILLSIDGGLKEFKTFRLNKPERFVIDLFGVTSALPSRFIPLNAVGVASARIGLYPDKVRVVLDAVNGSFPEAAAAKSEEGLLVSLAHGAIDKPAPKPDVIHAEKPASAKTKAAEEAAPAVKVAAPVPQTVTAEKPTAKVEKPAAVGPASIEMIDFQVIENISRVAVQVKGDVSIEQPVKTPGFVTLTIPNTVLPKRLQRSLETQSFVSPVLRITPFVVKTRKGSNTKVRIAMRAAAPFEFRREGDMVFVDFKTPEGITAEKFAAETQLSRPQATKAAKPSAAPATDLTAELSPAADSGTKSIDTVKSYKGRKVTLEFADAEVRKIFQLLAEVSNKNFVLGDEVGGTISIKLVNVPWDQALDIILDTKGLDKREDGNIIIIKGKGKFKSQAEEEQELLKVQTRAIKPVTATFSINYADVPTIAAQLDKLKISEKASISSDARTNTVIVTDIPQAIEAMRKLLQQLDVPEKQVMIEARIVEATATFSRSIGVNWGVHFRDPSASFLGINQLDTAFGGAVATAPPTSGASSSSGGSMGISFGMLNANVNVAMRLNAAASAGLVKIVSTPKVATLNNKTAKITQGQQIPYTSATSDKTETKFVEAALALEVTPHINANGTIGLKIDAKNDSPGAVPVGSTAPSINKKQATTEMLLRDGETTVIGGIYIDNDTENDDGVPFLMDIPFLGKLFKSNTKSKTKTELLIFITPRILSSI